ncbi:hypothetical protein HZA99_03715 [Candidatus Woesearchaeota archaeon]|nr:hypothetical protein [Candidatus Woesearchaeota archaeon]
MIQKINELRHLFDLYTLTTPPLDILVGSRADHLSGYNGVRQYVSFPTGRASPRYVVSLPTIPKMYTTPIIEDSDQSFIDDLVAEAVDRHYALIACHKLFQKIERDQNNLHADKRMYQIFTQHPEIALWFPEELLFWKILALGKGKRLYQTTFQAPEECVAEATRYALHAARIICEESQGILYDETEDRMAFLNKDHIPNRRLVCVSPRTLPAEREYWNWISCKK